MTAHDAAAERGSWRELAVARSLDPARARAEKRVQRFLDAALDLMQSGPDKEFTVQEVVERSGQSLRSFYQYFAGKHELLLALFEEAVRSAAERVRESIGDEGDAGERLHRFVVECYRLCRPTAKAKGKRSPTVMAEFAQQLLTSHPTEAAQAFAPMRDLLVEALDDAAAAGAVRSGLNHLQIAGVLLEGIMFNASATTISGRTARQSADAGAEQLWDLIFHGIAAR